MPGIGISITNKLIRQGTLLNQDTIPEGALQFEDSTEYIFFEGDAEENYITFEIL